MKETTTVTYHYHIISYHIADLKRQNRLKVGTNKPKLKVKMQSVSDNDVRKRHLEQPRFELAVKGVFRLGRCYIFWQGIPGLQASNWESTATDGWSLDRWQQKTIGACRTKRPSARTSDISSTSAAVADNADRIRRQRQTRRRLDQTTVWNNRAACWQWLFQTWKFWRFSCSHCVVNVFVV